MACPATWALIERFCEQPVAARHALYKAGFVLNGLGVLLAVALLFTSESVTITDTFKNPLGSITGMPAWVRRTLGDGLANVVNAWGGRVSLAIILVGFLLQWPETFAT